MPHSQGLSNNPTLTRIYPIPCNDTQFLRQILIFSSHLLLYLVSYYMKKTYKYNFLLNRNKVKIQIEYSIVLHKNFQINFFIIAWKNMRKFRQYIKYLVSYYMKNNVHIFCLLHRNKWENSDRIYNDLLPPFPSLLPSPFLTCCAVLPTSFGSKGAYLRQ